MNSLSTLIGLKSKSILSILCLCVILSSLQGQNRSEYFKYVPPLTSEDPPWVHLMYSHNPNVHRVVGKYDAYYARNPFVKNIHTQNYKYWLKNIQHLIDPQGYISNKNNTNDPLMTNALQKQTKRNQTQTLGQQQIQRNHRTTSGTWRPIGPFEAYIIGGSESVPFQANVYCLDIAPSDADIMYAGTESGGVYKSVDHGLNWRLTSSNERFTRVQEVKIHPANPDIVYIATSTNIHKTTDGGRTWSLNFTAPATVEQFYIDRQFPDSVFAATAAGLLYTTNGGGSWTNIFNKRCWDIEVHATNANTLFLSVSNTVAKRAEIYRSDDRGASWQLKDNRWYTPSDLAHASDIGCKIAVTPADTNRVYACLIGSSKAGDNGWIGVYYSLDKAETWVNADGRDGGPYAPGNNPNTNWYVVGYGNSYHQGWYNFDLAASHRDADKIWIGSIHPCESGNRGANIASITNTRPARMHADVQDIEVVGNEIWFASDGGINYSDDEMRTTQARNTGIDAAEFWGFAHGWNEDVFTGGRYHNSDAVQHENFGAGNSIIVGGVEAPTGYINPFDNQQAYYSDANDIRIPDSLNRQVINTTNLGLYPNESYFLLNSSEIEHHPHYADHLYLGRDSILYRSTNKGIRFEPLFGFARGARVLEFEISRHNPDIIYCLVRENNLGIIYRSGDGGRSFTATTSLPSNNRYALDLTLNPTNPDNLWVSTYYGGNGRKVYATYNGGTTWVNKTTSALDGHSIADIVYQYGSSETVYIATNHAVFYWNSTLSRWVLYKSGLPFLTTARKLFPFYRDNKIRMVTARGVWEAPLASPSLPLAYPYAQSPIAYCSRDTLQFEDYSVLNHASASWRWHFDPLPAYISDTTARNPRIVLSPQTDSLDVRLTITDSQGNSHTQTMTNMIIVQNTCAIDSLPGLALKASNPGEYVLVSNIDRNQVSHFTFSAWVKPKGIQNPGTAILMNDGVGAGLNFGTGNKLAYHWPSGAWWWDSGITLDTGVWSHVALVVEPTSVKIYLNGVASTHQIQLSPVDISSMRIGSFQGLLDRTYIGEIDEVALWTRALSEQEIKSIRHLTLKGTESVSRDLLAYYQFNATSTSVVYDRVANHHGQLIGSAAKVVSTIPAGGGRNHRMPVSSPGAYTFGNTGVSIDFGTVTPNGEIWVNHIENSPDSLPHPPVSGNSSTQSYWVVNNYGTASFSRLEGITFPYADTLSDPRQVILYKRSSNEHLNNWDSLCRAIQVGGGVVHFDTGGNIAGFSQFLVQERNSMVTFEVGLVSFTAGMSNNNVILNWETSREINNRAFEVERSQDGVTFSRISSVGGRGNSIVRQAYSFLDTSPAGDINYYRLKKTYDNGSFKLFSNSFYCSFEIYCNSEINSKPFDTGCFEQCRHHFF